jgi:hypothetical protein
MANPIACVTEQSGLNISADQLEFDIYDNSRGRPNCQGKIANRGGTMPTRVSYRSQACRRSSPATAAQAIRTGSGTFQRNSTARLTAQINMVGRS